MSVNIKNICDSDIPKHKKKSVYKGLPRANHKHEYETGVVRIDSVVSGKAQRHIYKAEICKICGRVGSMRMFSFNKEETAEMLKMFPHYYMNDLCDKVAIKEVVDCESNGACPSCFCKADGSHI